MVRARVNGGAYFVNEKDAAMSVTVCTTERGVLGLGFLYDIAASGILTGYVYVVSWSSVYTWEIRTISV